MRSKSRKTVIPLSFLRRKHWLQAIDVVIGWFVHMVSGFWNIIDDIGEFADADTWKRGRIKFPSLHTHVFRFVLFDIITRTHPSPDVAEISNDR